VASVMGYIQGTYAPGLQDWPAGLAGAHHLLLSHGRAVPVVRSNVPDGLVGISPDAWPATAASNSVEDIDAARHYDGHRQRWFLDPIFGFGYPQDIIDDYLQAGYIDNDPPSWLITGDLEEIAAPIDFLGLNYYGSHVISTHRTGNALEPGTNPPATHTEMGWEITPWALTGYLEHLDQRYKPAAIFITENGASYSDAPGEEGQVEDHRRISYLASHIEAVEKAIAAGVPVEGYFVWSLFDNLEWTQGFSQRFGLVWVDHRTGERTPKLSFQWYAEVIARGGLPA
jgi:beta-glucosidase